MTRLRTIDELLAMALDHTEFMLCNEVGAQLFPTWWIQFDDRLGEMIVTPWNSEDEQLLVLEMIREKLKDPHARNYAFASEMWVANENAKRPTGLMPSQHPNRREAVLMHAFSRDGKSRVKIYHIKRDGRGVVTTLDENKPAGDGVFQGRMHNLFADERTQHAVVARGKAKFDANTTRVPLSHCLDCGQAIDAGTPMPDTPDSSAPRPGDLAICLNCAHIMAYADNLTVRSLTDTEMVEVAGDPDIVRAVNAIGALNKREQRHG